MTAASGPCGVGRTTAPELPPCPEPGLHVVSVLRDRDHVLCDRHFQKVAANMPPGSTMRDYNPCAAGRYLHHDDWPDKPCQFEGVEPLSIGTPGLLWLCPDHYERFYEQIARSLDDL